MLNRKNRATYRVWVKMLKGYTAWSPSKSGMAYVVPGKHVIGKEFRCRRSTMERLEALGKVVSETVQHDDGREGDTYWRLAPKKGWQS